MTSLVVRTDVARDLDQSAAFFKNERLVVWEYVSNGLDYVDRGTSPVVRVRLDSRGKRITIEDNGRGMDWEGLENFFVMHGENLDRKAGRPGRGRFGTGKSAAFGIGDVLRLTTVRNGKRSKVELTRADLEGLKPGDPVPVTTIERELPTKQPNGTLVEIEDIKLRSFDQAGVVSFVERHLAHWPKDVTVIVNNHECEYNEPQIERTVSFRPEGEQADLLGDVALEIKISLSPLGEDERGISIYSNGVWHETTLLTSAGKDMAEFLFGRIDVPALDTDSSTPKAFDSSRSLRLNPENQLVAAIHSFIGPKIDEVRKQLVEAQRERRASEEAKRLRREAEQIEEIINNDFDAYRKRLQKVRAATSGQGFDASEQESTNGSKPSSSEEDFLYGGDDPATIVEESGEVGKNQPGPGSENGEPRRLNPIVEPDEDGDSTGHSERRDGQKPRRRGGFQIEFDNQGEGSARAVYQREKRTIYINLDHPQIAAAKQGHGIEDPVFRRLAYEVAFAEYAIALAYELDYREEFPDAADAIYEIRETIHRIAREAAALYA
jgi:hypothetical protein